MKIFQTRFGDVNLVNTAKYDFYKLCQIIKDLEVFFNFFLFLQNKARIFIKQAIDPLYKKLSNEVKAHQVFFSKKTDLLALVTFLQEMDSNLKIFAKSFYCIKDAATASAFVSKPLSKTLSLAPAKPSTSVRVTIIALKLSRLTNTYSGLIEVLTAVNRRSNFQEKKDHCNYLGLYYYCGKPGHIAFDHKNLEKSDTKKEADGITNHSITLVPNFSLIEEKELCLI